MPFMQAPRTLRQTPNGAGTLVTTAPNDEVNILEESTENKGWVKVDLVDAVGTGWVLSTAVGDAPPVASNPNIDMPAFFRQCWREGLSSAVSPHYLAGVAKLRSDIKGDTQNNQIGPFRFLQAEWDAGRKDPALKLIDFSSGDIKQWDFQLAMFAAMAARDFAALETALTRPPSAHELYLAQLIGPQATAAAVKKPADTIQVDLTGVPDTALPIGGLTRDQIMTRHAKYLLDPGPPPASVQGNIALDRIATDLQTALDAVKAGIITAGTDVLGVAPRADQLVDDAKQPGPAQAGPGGPLPNTPSGAGPAGSPEAGGALGQLISRGEGNYSTFNRGNAGDSPRKKIDFSQMTIRDIMALQSLPPGNSQRLFAVGKYQVIPVTMRGAVAALGIGADEKFGPSLQEKVFRDYLIADKRPNVKRFITGQSNDLFAAQLALALEFASVADPNTGRSHYGGSGGNRASIKTAETAAALNAERTKYKAKITAGKSPHDAWEALSA
jgi:hypothetical protein